MFSEHILVYMDDIIICSIMFSEHILVYMDDVIICSVTFLEHILVCMDDIIICSVMFSEHISALISLFGKLREAGIQLKLIFWVITSKNGINYRYRRI